MTRPKQRTALLNEHKKNRLGKIRELPVVKQVVDAMVWVYSVIVEGLIYSVARRLFAHNEIEVPGKNEFYELQQKISAELIQMTRERVKIERLKMLPGSLVSIDGSWDHRRNGSMCVVTMIDKRTNKIVDFEITTKPKQYVEGNTTVASSKLLEKIAIE